MLTEDEFEYILTKISEQVDSNWLGRMFNQKHQPTFLRVEFEHLFREVVRERPEVALPSVEQLERAIDEIRLEST